MNELTSPAPAGKSFARLTYNEPLLCGWRVDVLGDRAARCTHFYWHGVSLCSKRRISAEAARMPEPAGGPYWRRSPSPCPRCLRRSRKYRRRLEVLRINYPLAPIARDYRGDSLAPRLEPRPLLRDPRLRGDVDAGKGAAIAPATSEPVSRRPAAKGHTPAAKGAWGNGIPMRERTRYS